MSTAVAQQAPLTATSTRALSRRRLSAMRGLAWFMAISAIVFGLFTIVFGIIGPDQEVHAFHNAVVAALLLVLSAPPAMAVARSPERSMRPLVFLAALGLAGLATMAASLTLDPFTLPFVVLIGVLWVLRPRATEALLPSEERTSLPMLALVLVGSVPLMSYALGQAEFQRIDTVSSHDTFFHWIETSFYAFAVIMLALLAALRPSAYRLAAWCAGVALAVLGTASLGLNGYASALDPGWAAAATVGGLAFIGLAEWEGRRERVIGGTRLRREATR